MEMEQIRKIANALSVAYQYDDDIEVLVQYAKKVNGKTIVEFGTALGKSCLVLALAAPDSRIITFDPTPNPHINEILKKHNIDKQVTLIREKSEECTVFCPDNIGLIFHDGVHSHKSVIENFHVWKDTLLSGGYFMFHDYKLYRNTVGFGVDEIKTTQGWEDIGLTANIYVLRKK